MSITIKFWKETENPYGILSNFYSAPITIEGVLYKTTEEYYQTCKFDETDPIAIEYIHLIKSTSTPYKAKMLGHQQRINLPYKWVLPLNEIIDKYNALGLKRKENWESIKESVMKIALTAKFTQHPKLFQVLRETGDAYLIENSPHDTYWGRNNNGHGLNVLGELLVQLRDSNKD